MVVFNPIEFDGRVKRAAEALNKAYQLIVFCPASEKTSENDLPEEIGIRRAWLPWKKWPTSLSLPVFWLQFVFLSAIIRPKLIYSHDFYLPLPGIFAAKLIRAKSIYDAHELIISEQGQQKSLRQRFFYWCERISIGRYDLVVAANNERAKLMKIHYALNTMPTPIRNVSKPTLGNVDCARIIETYPQLLREKDEQFIVYMGDVSLKRGLANVIESLSYLPNNISLVVIGDGPDWDKLREIAIRINRRQQRLRLLGAIPQRWIQDALSLCDVGVLTYSLEGLNNVYCSPNKLFEYTQAGLPVVSTAQPTLEDMIGKYGLGSIVGENNRSAEPWEYAEAVINVLNDHQSLKANLAAFVSQNSVEVEQKHLLDSIGKIMMGNVCA